MNMYHYLCLLMFVKLFLLVIFFNIPERQVPNSHDAFANTTKYENRAMRTTKSAA